MAGNVYLSLSIEEITCKETKRGRQVLTQSSLQAQHHILVPAQTPGTVQYV